MECCQTSGAPIYYTAANKARTEIREHLRALKYKPVKTEKSIQKGALQRREQLWVLRSQHPGKNMVLVCLLVLLIVDISRCNKNLKCTKIFNDQWRN
ncbi:hypothetical protein XELAEV_18008444mg [Xenopus laevis]|uniref:Uncharacterized protein n=1 Tax=Xenopus laevis TaxID=8355 RepID=A0A974I5D8_XENLA|nr:hypothetical protein XELAEV_18008444mg [Xenopus laevis]